LGLRVSPSSKLGSPLSAKNISSKGPPIITGSLKKGGPNHQKTPTLSPYKGAKKGSPNTGLKYRGGKSPINCTHPFFHKGLYVLKRKRGDSLSGRLYWIPRQKKALFPRKNLGKHTSGGTRKLYNFFQGGFGEKIILSLLLKDEERGPFFPSSNTQKRRSRNDPPGD